MNAVTEENITKLMGFGFTQKKALKALNLKKSLPLAYRWLLSQRKTEGNQPEFNTESEEVSSEEEVTKLSPFGDTHKASQDPENFLGEIKFIDTEKAFGFIKFEDSDIFFHFSDKVDPEEELILGDEVYFVIGENRNPGKNMGRLCAKKIMRKGGSVMKLKSLKNHVKRQGVILEIGEKYGFVRDKKSQKCFLFTPSDYVHTFNVGDYVLFFVELRKVQGITLTNAVQMELVNQIAPVASPSRGGPTADLSKNYFYRHDTYPADESRRIEFKALTKATHLTQRIMDIAEKYLVAFLNADGGKTLCGILDDGHIVGLKMPRKVRDEIRLGVDALVAQIRPAVTNDLYAISFIPVVGRRERLEEFFVMCLSCEKGNAIYVDSKHNAWIRRDGSVRTMSVPMAQVLWQKRMEEKQPNKDSSSLKDLIKSTISSELRKAVRDERPRESLFGPLAAIDVSAEGDERKVINLIDFGEGGKKAPEICILDAPIEEESLYGDDQKEIVLKEKHIQILLAEGHTLPNALESLYIASKEHPNLSQKQILSLARKKLSASKEPLDELDPFGEIYNAFKKTKEKDTGDLLSRVENVISETIGNAELNIHSNVDTNELLNLEELKITPSKRRKEKSARKKDGLFDYLDEHDSFRRTTKTPENKGKINEKAEEKPIAKSKLVLDKNVADAINGKEDYKDEEKLYNMNKLVYPLTAKFMKKSFDFRAVLNNFLVYNKNISNAGSVSLPTYKTAYKNNTFSSLLMFKFDRMDYFFKIDGSKKYDLAEEMVTKKALFQMEDKGLLFLYESADTSPESNKCEFCHSPVSPDNLRDHQKNCLYKPPNAPDENLGTHKI